MLLKRNKGPKQNAQNVPVKVAAYEERDGVLGVVGTNLLNDEEVFVTLTDRGEAADNAKRPGLDKFRDHKVFAKDDVGVDPGGIILFNGTWKVGEGRLVSRWPEYMASNEEDAKQVRVKSMTTVLLRESSNGDLFGSLVVWQPNSTKPATADNLEEVVAALVDGVAKSIKNASGNEHGVKVLVRGLNADNEITGYATYTTAWNKEEGRYMSGQEVAEKFRETASFKAMTENEDAVAFEVLPAVELPLSRETVQSKADKVQAWARSYQDKYGLRLFAKPTTYRTEATGRFVVQLAAAEPFGPGVGPECLAPNGELRKLSPKLEQEENQAYQEAVEEIKKEESAASSEMAQDNPFAEAPSM